MGDYLERIEKEEALNVWKLMEPKLRRFWEEDMSPEIIDSRINRGFKCRMPAYRLEALKAKDESKKQREEEKQIKKFQIEERKRLREEKKQATKAKKEEAQKNKHERAPRKKQIQVKIPLFSSVKFTSSDV